MSTLDPEQAKLVRHWIQDVKDRFQREIDQGILKRDLYQSVEAMGGRDACDRIWREIEARCAMFENARQVFAIEDAKREQRRRGIRRGIK
jgi:hypothetical protein